MFTGARTKLIATIGPASDRVEAIGALVDAGAAVFRVNFAHGSPEEQAARVAGVREVERERDASVAILADLPGPKVRLGELTERTIRLRTGDRFVLDSGRPPGDATGAPVDYGALASDVRSGDRILIADGAVELIVRAVEHRAVVTEVARGGEIRPRVGVNIPAHRLSLPAITERDRDALGRALDCGVDFVGQSFVRAPEDVRELGALMGDRPVPIVAKIETRPAAEAADRIMDAADAIMVARGDLGVEMPLEVIPVLQKELLSAARFRGIPGIVATQMLESMIHAPRPTRAEASDVANAVLDGADAVMLAAETAVGEYAVEAAQTALAIAQVAEGRAGRFRLTHPSCHHTGEAAAVAHAAAQVAAEDQDVVAIAAYTESGLTAQLISSERPAVATFAFSPHQEIRRRLGLRWGVRALPASDPSDTDAMIEAMDRGLREVGAAREGDVVVIVASSPAGKSSTNMLKVHHIGSPVR
jgi:pyruvate kinase